MGLWKFSNWGRSNFNMWPKKGSIIILILKPFFPYTINARRLICNTELIGQKSLTVKSDSTIDYSSDTSLLSDNDVQRNICVTYNKWIYFPTLYLQDIYLQRFNRRYFDDGNLDWDTLITNKKCNYLIDLCFLFYNDIRL